MLFVHRPALIVATMLALFSCQHQTPQSDEIAAEVSPASADCRTIQHEAGETEICGQPKRIVALGSYTLEPLLALNIQPVAYADHLPIHQGDYTNPSQQIPYLGDRITQPIANVGVAYTPSVESILKVQPDLILGIDEMGASQYEKLSSIAPTLWLDYDRAEENLRVIASAINHSDRASELLTKTRSQIKLARELFSDLVLSNPNVLLLGGSELKSIRVFTKSAGLCSSLLESLGFKLVIPPNIDKDNLARGIPISLEALTQFNDADLVIFLGHKYSNLKSSDNVNSFEDNVLSDLKTAWKKNAIAQSLNASKVGKVYFIPTYLCAGLPGSIGTDLYLKELKRKLLLNN